MILIFEKFWTELFDWWTCSYDKGVFCSKWTKMILWLESDQELEQWHLWSLQKMREVMVSSFNDKDRFDSDTLILITCPFEYRYLKVDKRGCEEKNGILNQCLKELLVSHIMAQPRCHEHCLALLDRRINCHGTKRKLRTFFDFLSNLVGNSKDYERIYHSPVLYKYCRKY